MQFFLEQVLSQWHDFFKTQQEQPYFSQLTKNVASQYYIHDCYPAWKHIFRIFSLVPPQDIKIIIVGQDPYYLPWQADGVAFSASNLKSNQLPKSLYNIFCELKHDLGIDHFQNGSLDGWVQQGVWLMNTIWSVQKQHPGSHQNIGWEIFTQALLRYLLQINEQALILVGWGRIAQKILIPFLRPQYQKLFTAHPSPLSYYRGFQNSLPFSRMNNWLHQQQQTIIDWSR